jgi:hypothetical protein
VSALDDLLGPLIDAAEVATFPLRGDGRECWRPRMQEALAAALRGTVVDQGGQEIPGDRLTVEDCRAAALSLLGDNLPNNPGQRDAIVQLVASLLRDVREADQRERWIRDGYAFDSRLAWERAEEAERRAAELEHAVRLVKRATRDVRVGRG